MSKFSWLLASRSALASASWAAGRRTPNTARLVALAARKRLMKFS